MLRGSKAEAMLLSVLYSALQHVNNKAIFSQSRTPKQAGYNQQHLGFDGRFDICFDKFSLCEFILIAMATFDTSP